MHMSKSIRLSEDAYERLAAHKGEDELSEVVLRLVGEWSLLDLAGVLSDEEAADLRAAARTAASDEPQNSKSGRNAWANPDVARHVVSHRPDER